MLIVRFSTFKRIYSILLVKTNKKPMKRIVALIFYFLTKINAQEYFPNNESVQNKKTTILLLLQTLRFCKSNANN
jgi:hypothetical protein